jgi:hypothetical protein
MRFRIAVLVLALAGCGNGDGSEEPKPTCTAEQTTQFAADSDLSKLLAAGADQTSKDALKSMVIDACCPICSSDSITERPLVVDMEACVACANTYSGGNPADHVSACGKQVCKVE